MTGRLPTRRVESYKLGRANAPQFEPHARRSPRENDMGFMAKLFNAVPAEERKGIHLDYRIPQWKLSKAKDLPAFLRALADLAPADSMLYLEGGTPPA